MKKLLLVALFCVGVFSASAQAYLQDPNYGANEAERTENAKLYSAFQFSINLKDFKRASFELKELLNKIPKATDNLYIRGVDVYRNLYAKAETDAQRKVCLDSILTIYDLRSENFGNRAKRGRAYILAQKALAFNNYASDEDKLKLYQVFRDAIEAGKDVIDDEDVEIIGNYFTNLTNSYKYDEITADDYLTSYELIMKNVEGVDNEFATQIKNDVEALFAQSGAASCENIEKIFKPMYDLNPNDNDLIKKILGLFSRAKCNSNFQAELLEKYYKIDPQPEFAAMLASIYEERKDYAKAMEFMTVAINNEKDPVKKTSFLLRASGQLLAIERYKDAAGYAKQVMDMDPNNGMAYYLYANALNSGVATGCSGDARMYAMWLIYDAFNQAYQRLPEGDAQRENARTAMGQCAANFPKKQDLFMNALEDGQGYTVNCGWVSGRTTIRGR